MISCSARTKTVVPERRIVPEGSEATGTNGVCRMVEDAANGFRKVVASRARYPRHFPAGVMPPLQAACGFKSRWVHHH